MTVLNFKQEAIKGRVMRVRKCTQETDISKRASNTWAGCPLHGLEGYGGINNRITIQIDDQVKYYNRTYTKLPDAMIGEYQVGVVREDKVWLAYEKGETHQVRLVRDGVSISFRDFVNFSKAASFADGLKKSPEICERAFNSKLAENIKAEAAQKHNFRYSNFLCNAIRDTQAMSDEDAINECKQLIEIIKTRSKE